MGHCRQRLFGEVRKVAKIHRSSLLAMFALGPQLPRSPTRATSLDDVGDASRVTMPTREHH
ncbi:hypothetical protein [Mycobacterium leprae]|uniref:hypothetical protein n=1 Tax=Mycobacterium leprae TaxID=1769 RepID=UPI0002FA2006|nr:hypothetical protein [Mycobacterium leprae]